MMCRDHRQCILPPHMIEAIKMRGDASLKKKMTALEKVSETTRVQREASTPQSGRNDYRGGSGAFPVGAKPKPDRRVFDGGGSSALPGSPARFEGDAASGDKVVNQAFNGAGDVFKMYRDGFDRNSIDGQG